MKKHDFLVRPVHRSWFIAFLVFGVIFGVLLPVMFWPWIASVFSSNLWLLAAALLFIFSIIVSRRLLLIAAFIAGTLIGTVRTAPFVFARDIFSRLGGQEIAVSGVIISDPTEKNGQKSFDLGSLKLSGTALAGKIRASVGNKVEVGRGDTITIVGKMRPGYADYFGSISRASVIYRVRDGPNPVLKLRDLFSQNIIGYADETASGLGLGYLFGIKDKLPVGLSEEIKTVGLAHIIVVSGTHLGIVVGVMKKLFRRRNRKALFAALAVFLYLMITGITPSMLRAGMITILGLIAWYFGRPTKPWRKISYVLMLTLLYNPFYIFNIGWQLSFASFSGVIVIYPRIRRFLYGAKKPNFVADSVMVSSAASLVCLPVQLYAFGTFNLLSIAANLFILPTVSIAMLVAFLTGATGIFFAWFKAIPMIAGEVLNIIIGYQVAVMDKIYEYDFLFFEIEKNNTAVFLLYLPIILVVTLSVIYEKFNNRFRDRKECQNKQSARRQGECNP